MSYKLSIKIKNAEDGVYTLSLSLIDNKQNDMIALKLEVIYRNRQARYADKVDVYSKKIIDMTILNDACLIDFIGDSIYDFIGQLGYINYKSSKEYTYSDSFAEKVKRSTLRHLEGDD
jgi:hypothetical protein|nr:MAG TPA: hypothetical protein [Caudoviricetes sp.]